VITTTTCPTASTLRRELETLPGTSTAVLMRDLPVEDERRRRLIMESVAALVGPPRCYPMSRYEPGPVHELAEAAPSLAAEGLDWHTEDSFAPAPPAFVALLCVQGDEQVKLTCVA
jgi:alpha-ketoglutarate-dependent taurine dioxygenase